MRATHKHHPESSCDMSTIHLHGTHPQTRSQAASALLPASHWLVSWQVDWLDLQYSPTVHPLASC
jgi:hypothetical protein